MKQQSGLEDLLFMNRFLVFHKLQIPPRPSFSLTCIFLSPLPLSLSWVRTLYLNLIISCGYFTSKNAPRGNLRCNHLVTRIDLTRPFSNPSHDWDFQLPTWQYSGPFVNANTSPNIKHHWHVAVFPYSASFSI